MRRSERVRINEISFTYFVEISFSLHYLLQLVSLIQFTIMQFLGKMKLERATSARLLRLAFARRGNHRGCWDASVEIEVDRREPPLMYFIHPEDHLPR